MDTEALHASREAVALAGGAIRDTVEVSAIANRLSEIATKACANAEAALLEARRLGLELHGVVSALRVFSNDEDTRRLKAGEPLRGRPDDPMKPVWDILQRFDM